MGHETLVTILPSLNVTDGYVHPDMTPGVPGAVPPPSVPAIGQKGTPALGSAAFVGFG
jgi:hypothetical protein